MTRTLCFLSLIATLAAQQASLPAPVPVTVVNTLAIARPAETITLTAAALRELLPFTDLRMVHVYSGTTDLLTQAIDIDDDGTLDELIFQVDLGSRETKRLTVGLGERRIPRREDFRAYGRFNRERRDDFAWENDVVAYRMYGAALESWKQEPLTSSALDVWVKSTPRLIINDWYMIDDYHRNTGEGADLYSAGKTRGCGGSGLWRNGRLYTSPNFRNTRVLAQGPIRVMFELMYEGWDAGGTKVSETKRVTLDAGSHFSRFDLAFTPAPPAGSVLATGIRNNAGSTAKASPESGTLRGWEPLKDNGSLGCAVILPGMTEMREADGNYLALGPAAAAAMTYYAGSAWDRGGQVKSVDEWDALIAREAARVRTPVTVTIGITR
jgi:hypothetical protein